MWFVEIIDKSKCFVENVFWNAWENRKNPKLTFPFLFGVLAVLYASSLLHLILAWFLYLLVVKFSVLSGLAFVLCRGKFREPPAPLLTADQQNVNQFMEKMTKSYSKHYYRNRLVISKDLDKTIQSVIDLIIRDFCLSWFSDIGKDETAFLEILNNEIWTVIENLMERLNEVDKINFLCSEMVFLLYNHFHDLRLSDARQFPGQTTPFLLHPCLKDKMSEIKYLRTCAEALLVSLLPERNSKCAVMRYMLREIIAGSLFLPTAESICDPDYINQTLVIYLEDREKITETRKQKYAYAETYEDFIKMINATTDVDILKQIRYHTIAEIMQATVIHNSKDQQTQDGSKTKTKLSKKEALRERNLKRYINQCRVSKSQCEKRIRQLGGPDYRRYGLGHGQPLETKGKKHKVEKRTMSRLKSTKILSFSDILDNSLARSHFIVFLQRHGHENLLSFWIAIERSRLSKEDDLLRENANKIFQEFVTPSAVHVIKFQSSLVRGMEEFVYGKSGPESFHEAQKVAYDTMEGKFYAEFVVSPDYTDFVCQSESALDQMRAHLGEEEDDLIDWSDGFNFKERRNAEITKAGMPSHIEERNDYAVHSLQALDQNITAKCQALELLKRSTASSEEQKELEKEIDQLNTDRRQLEFHIERTDLWCEMLGHWKAIISTVQYDAEDGQPIFLICVSCGEESTEMFHNSGNVPTGWIVARKLKDFKALHDKLKECSSWMSKELPVSSKKWYQKQGSENLESLKTALQEYLSIILGDEVLSRSDKLYAFLIPSPDHLRGQTAKTEEKEKKNILQNLPSSFKNISKSLPNLNFQDIPMPFVDAVDADELEAGIEEDNPQDRKDSIAEPMYRLIGEVFELKGVFKILRKTLISFVQITFGGTINRHLREFVSWLVSGPMMIYYIDNFKLTMWPKGKLAPYPPPRTDLEKLRTREQAKEKMMKSIPDVLQNLVGKKNSKVGFMKLFEAIQDVRTNKHLFYIFLELIIITICPEIKSNEVLQSLQRKIGRKLTREKIHKESVNDDVFNGPPIQPPIHTPEDHAHFERQPGMGLDSQPGARFNI